MPEPKVATTSLQTCLKCGAKLHLAKENGAGVEAKVYDLTGVSTVIHHKKECCNRSCRMRYCYNYRVEGKHK
eukprot:5846948-Alexandrium_andersonii.AAC.1